MIPLRHREIINATSWFKRCAFPDHDDCEGRVEIHHACKYKGKQVNEMWGYIPLCHHHHNTQKGKYWAELIAILFMPDEHKLKYGKFDWDQRLKYLWHKLCLPKNKSET